MLQPITARDLIRRAMMLPGILASGENPSSSEANDALQTLNEIVDKWNTENLMLPSTKIIAFPLNQIKSVYTIGLSTDPFITPDIPVNRPVAGIESAYVVYGDVNIPIKQMDREQFLQLYTENVTSTFPNMFWYNPSFPLGEIYLYPKPSENHIMMINVGNQLSEFSSLDELISLPPAYIKALRYNLAVELAIEYGKEYSNFIELATGAKATIKSINSNQREILMGLDSGLLVKSAGFNYRTGDC